MLSLRNAIQIAVDRRQLPGFSGSMLGLSSRLHMAAPTSGRKLIITLENLPALPAQYDFDSGYITLGGGVPVGGSSHVTIFSDGTSVFSGSLHDSGATAYNTALVCVVKDTQNIAYTFAHQGSVAGTLESGSRDDIWNVPGTPNAHIKTNWADLAGARPTFQLSVTLDLGSLLSNVISAIGAIAQVISLAG